MKQARNSFMLGAILVTICGVGGVHLLKAQTPDAKAPAPDLLTALTWRSIGPGLVGGRINDLAVPIFKPGEGRAPGSVVYIAAATGGVWKTTNGGASWESLFDQQPTLAIGAVAVAPSNPNIVWAGTGDSGDPATTETFGTGIYKSEDGGKTWKLSGLKDSFYINRIAVHPAKPEIVLVAVQGPMSKPSAARGITARPMVVRTGRASISQTNGRAGPMSRSIRQIPTSSTQACISAPRMREACANLAPLAASIAPWTVAPLGPTSKQVSPKAMWDASK
jgi:hypothetical protein